MANKEICVKVLNVLNELNKEINDKDKISQSETYISLIKILQYNKITVGYAKILAQCALANNNSLVDKMAILFLAGYLLGIQKTETNTLFGDE